MRIIVPVFVEKTDESGRVYTVIEERYYKTNNTHIVEEKMIKGGKSE